MWWGEPHERSTLRLGCCCGSFFLMRVPLSPSCSQQARSRSQQTLKGVGEETAMQWDCVAHQIHSLNLPNRIEWNWRRTHSCWAGLHSQPGFVPAELGHRTGAVPPSCALTPFPWLESECGINPASTTQKMVTREGMADQQRGKYLPCQPGRLTSGLFHRREVNFLVHWVSVAWVLSYLIQEFSQNLCCEYTRNAISNFYTTLSSLFSTFPGLLIAPVTYLHPPPSRFISNATSSRMGASHTGGLSRRISWWYHNGFSFCQWFHIWFQRNKSRSSCELNYDFEDSGLDDHLDGMLVY